MIQPGLLRQSVTPPQGGQWLAAAASPLLPPARRMLPRLGEADPMAWSPRPNRTKLINDARRSQRMASRLDQRRRQETARIAASQRARQQLAGQFSGTISTIIRRDPRLAALPGLQAIAAAVGTETSLELFAYLQSSNAAGTGPSLGGFVAARFKVAARAVGWPPTWTELAATALAEGFDRSASPAIRTFLLTLSVVLPKAGRSAVDLVRDIAARVRGAGEFERAELAIAP